MALRDLTFAYQEGTDVIRRSACRPAPGEIVALIGPSGEGKTTLIRLILGLIHPRAGEVVSGPPTGGKLPMPTRTPATSSPTCPRATPSSRAPSPRTCAW